MENSIFKDLKKQMFEYDEDKIKETILESLKRNISPLETIKVLTECISEIGDRFEKEELWLPDLMIAAKTMQVAIEPLELEIKKKGLKKESMGKVVIGTVIGDLHSIGKSMVATMLSAGGFEVIDLGVNVSSDAFIKSIKDYSPDVLAMSALLTTTASEQKKVITALEKEGLRNKVKIIVGGGPITKEFAEEIGADGYEPTAPLAAKLVKRLLQIK